MVAVLKLVPKPVTRPVYRRSDLLSYPEAWMRQNHDLLVGWFGESPAADWESFCRTQWEIECNQHDQFRETYRGP